MIYLQDLSHNKISVLPPGMGYLVRLVELNLSHNQLGELPPDIVNLRGRYLSTIKSSDPLVSASFHHK